MFWAGAHGAHYPEDFLKFPRHQYFGSLKLCEYMFLSFQKHVSHFIFPASTYLVYRNYQIPAREIPDIHATAHQSPTSFPLKCPVT